MHPTNDSKETLSLDGLSMTKRDVKRSVDTLIMVQSRRLIRLLTCIMSISTMVLHLSKFKLAIW